MYYRTYANTSPPALSYVGERTTSPPDVGGIKGERRQDTPSPIERGLG